MKGTLGVPVPSHLNKDKAVSSEQHGQCFSHSCWQTTQEVMPVLPVNSGASDVSLHLASYPVTNIFKIAEEKSPD